MFCSVKLDPIHMTTISHNVADILNNTLQIAEKTEPVLH